jgi:hypothetical protein
MRQFKEMTTKSRLCFFFLIIFLFSVPLAAAQNKVVVIPLFDNHQANGATAPVSQTGQTTSYETGDDGDLQLGVKWPDPRFTDNGDGTVRDHLTGLIWLKNANCFGAKIWHDALNASNNLATGQCGLSDGSSPGDWHLSNVRELQSLIDYGNYNPALPTGHPFSNVQSSFYWSSTTYANGPSNAWLVYMSLGHVSNDHKDNPNYVWPVRSDND